MQALGDLYLQNVMIQDKKNRIEGYAYYTWGHRE